jgi:hypothetical protein
MWLHHYSFSNSFKTLDVIISHDMETAFSWFLGNNHFKSNYIIHVQEVVTMA